MSKTTETTAERLERIRTRSWRCLSTDDLEWLLKTAQTLYDEREDTQKRLDKEIEDYKELGQRYMAVAETEQMYRRIMDRLAEGPDLSVLEKVLIALVGGPVAMWADPPGRPAGSADDVPDAGKKEEPR